MRGKWLRSMQVVMTVAQLPADDDVPPGLECPGCERAMDFHQPDADLPSRLLATCSTCRCWATLDYFPGVATMISVLPVVAPALEPVLIRGARSTGV